jgi:hypothetical protein
LSLLASGEGGSSKRPFAPHQRLSVSERPLADRRSWPASSLPGKARRRSVRLGTPFPCPFPGPGKITVRRPLSVLLLCRPDAAPGLLPFGTVIPPAHRLPWFATGELTIANVRFPLTPRKLRLSYFRITVTGSLRIAWLAVPRTLRGYPQPFGYEHPLHVIQ